MLGNVAFIDKTLVFFLIDLDWDENRIKGKFK